MVVNLRRALRGMVRHLHAEGGESYEFGFLPPLRSPPGAHGFMIGVRHPDGCQLSGSMKTGMVASRPFVVIGSPAFVGISEGATTSHRWPRPVIWRLSGRVRPLCKRSEFYGWFDNNRVANSIPLATGGRLQWFLWGQK